MSTDQDLDFSTRSVPDAWQDAASSAPGGGSSGAHRQHLLPALPSGTQADVFSGTMAAVVISLISGVGWYYLETTGTLVVPWASIVLGVLLALAIRAGAGPDDPGTRSALSLLFYVTTSAVVIYLIGIEVFADAYGGGRDFADFERHLRHSRFAEPVALACWVLGAAAAYKISSLTRRRV